MQQDAPESMMSGGEVAGDMDENADSMKVGKECRNGRSVRRSRETEWCCGEAVWRVLLKRSTS